MHTYGKLIILTMGYYYLLMQTYHVFSKRQHTLISLAKKVIQSILNWVTYLSSWSFHPPLSVEARVWCRLATADLLTINLNHVT